MKKTLKSILIVVILLAFFLFYWIHISQMMNDFLDYSLLFLQKIVPVQFPIFLFSSFFIHYGLFSFLPIPTSFSIFLLSLISGFPSGSRYAKDLIEKKEITIKEGNQILLFSHFPNPLFVFGSIASVLNFSLARKIFFSVFLSNFSIFLLSIKKEKKKFSFPTSEEEFSVILSKSIISISKTILLIYGTSIFFYFFSVFVTYYFSFSSGIFVFLAGLFDLTNGVFSTILFSSLIKRSYFILFFLSFGSIAIHMQTKSILIDTPLSYSSFLKGRILGTGLAFLFFRILLFF
ncbi:MAG: hypothetical protein IJI60_05335 [Bacilli bacterium]|nr:hypothetical protein [Bacilli bacterium]